MAWDRVRGQVLGLSHWIREKYKKKEKKKGEKGGKKGKAGEKERETGEERKEREITAVVGAGVRGRGMLDRPGYFCIKKCFQFYQLKLSQGL